MPTATNGGATLYYETDGAGETVAFVNDAGFGAWLWGWQQPAVAGPYEALVWDLRGTGRSDGPSDATSDATPATTGGYTVDDLAADLEAVLADHGTRRAHIVGAGLGGMVALRYARAYDRAASLVVLNAAASGEAVAGEYGGLFGDWGNGHSDGVTAAFSPEFVEGRPDLVERIAAWRREEDAGPEARRAQVGAARSFQAGPLYELALPALVFHGVDDPVVGLEAGRALADDLPRGQFEPVEGRHLCFIEHSRAVNDELLAFLAEQEAG